MPTDNPGSTGPADSRVSASDARLPAEPAIGVASAVGFGWLLLTDYELTQLLQGIVEDSVQTAARRLLEEVAVKLQRNADRDGSEALPDHVKTDRSGLEL